MEGQRISRHQGVVKQGGVIKRADITRQNGWLAISMFGGIQHQLDVGGSIRRFGGDVYEMGYPFSEIWQFRISSVNDSGHSGIPDASRSMDQDQSDGVVVVAWEVSGMDRSVGSGRWTWVVGSEIRIAVSWSGLVESDSVDSWDGRDSDSGGGGVQSGVMGVNDQMAINQRSIGRSSGR